MSRIIAVFHLQQALFFVDYFRFQYCVYYKTSFQLWGNDKSYMTTVETHILKSKFGCTKSMDHLHIIKILVKVIAENND